MRPERAEGGENFAQLCDSAGAAVGAAIAVETETYSTQAAPSVIAVPGGFVIAWQSCSDTTYTYDIRAQRFDASGTALGGEFTVNTTTAGNQYRPELAALSGGGFAAVWQDQGGNDGDGYGVYLRIFDAAGVAAGPDVLVNSYASGSQYEPSLAALTTGELVAVWRDDNALDGSGAAVFGQHFDSSGTPVGDAFLVNDITLSNQYQPEIVALPGGEFAVLHASSSGDGNGEGVFAQFYNADFSRKDGAVQVNLLTSSTQYQPDAAVLANGDIAVAFCSYTSGDGYGYGVFHQILGLSASYPAIATTPVIAGLDQSVQMALGTIAAPAILDHAVAVTDSDSADFAGGSLLFEFMGPWTSAGDTLDILAGTGIMVSGSDVLWNGDVIGTVDAVLDGTGGTSLLIALTAFAKPEAVGKLMERIAYSNSGTPTASDNITIGVTLTDGDGGRSTPNAIVVDIASSVSVPNFVFDGLDATVAMTEADLNAAPQVIDGNVDFQYNGTNGLENGYLSVSYQQSAIYRIASDHETLGVENQGTGAGQIGVSGSDISHGGTVFATVDATDDGLGDNNLRLAFNASATSEAVDALIESLPYRTTSVTVPDTVDFYCRVFDGGGVASSYEYLTIAITPEDDGGPVPLGGEERVNTETEDTQQSSDVAALDDGGYVIVWQSYIQDGDSHGIFAQRYDPEGQPSGPEFQVNDTYVGSQTAPTVAALQNGGFVVAWLSYGQDGSGTGIVQQRYDATGTSSGEVAVLPGGSYAVDYPVIATLSNGNVVVAAGQYLADGTS